MLIDECLSGENRETLSEQKVCFVVPFIGKVDEGPRLLVSFKSVKGILDDAHL